MLKAQTEVLPADRPLLPFLLMGTRGTVWYQTPVGLERNGGAGVGGGEWETLPLSVCVKAGCESAAYALFSLPARASLHKVPVINTD